MIQDNVDYVVAMLWKAKARQPGAPGLCEACALNAVREILRCPDGVACPVCGEVVGPMHAEAQHVVIRHRNPKDPDRVERYEVQHL